MAHGAERIEDIRIEQRIDFFEHFRFSVSFQGCVFVTAREAARKRLVASASPWENSGGRKRGPA
jgi:hypothetical protein